jgi:hypothetical protein
MPTRVKQSELDDWLKKRLPHVITLNEFGPLQEAGEWGEHIFKTPITGSIHYQDGGIFHDMYDEGFNWTWYKSSFYFRRARDAALFKLRWG